MDVQRILVSLRTKSGNIPYGHGTAYEVIRLQFVRNYTNHILRCHATPSGTRSSMVILGAVGRMPPNIAVMLALVVCTLAAPAPEPKPDPKAQLLAAAPLGYATYPYPYAISPYSSVLAPYTTYAYPSLAYSYNYPYALL
uniref:Uncharacterized protein n=1 Tax=Anopheles culicifacies TaxID=139723 RepID=A0A182M942_9DIPT